MTRTFIRRIGVLAVMATIWVAVKPAGAAVAAPTLTLNPTSAVAGAQITAVGVGFPTYGGNQIKLAIGQTVLATVPYQPPNFTAVFAAPNLPAGFHTVTACIASGGNCSTAAGTSAQARLKITAPTPTPAPPKSPAPQTPPAVPGDLQISMDPVCCDPPAPGSPQDLTAMSPTPGPVIKNPGPEQKFPDLYLLGVEVTQNIQDLKSRMPLVADRKTWVRVHPRANTGSWGPVDGAILVKHGSQQEILYPVNGPIFVGLTTDRTDTDAALNFVLDPQWYAEGTLSISALVWAYGPSTLDSKEPNPENNFMKLNVKFNKGSMPILNIVPLDDGAGPGPAPTNAWTTTSAQFVSNSIVRNHPIAGTDMTIYPIPLSPGTGGGNGGLGIVPAWDLTDGTGRTQPLQKLFWYHQVLNLPVEERLIGMFDSSIPAGGYTGWAIPALRSAWAKPSGTTPAHEASHLTGLGHVDCVGTEAKGGTLDKTHPNAAPNCSLAPISATGYFGMTVFDNPFTIYSNDPKHPKAAFPVMSYASVKWNDPYHWCKMLTYYDVPCSPEGIGVPGKPLPDPDPGAKVDCDKSVTGPNGQELKICLAAPASPSYNDIPTMPAELLKMAVPAKPTGWVLVSGVLDGKGGVITQAAVVDQLSPGLAELAAEDAAAGGGLGKSEIAVYDRSGGLLARVKVGGLGTADLTAQAALRHDDGAAVGEFAKVVPVAGDVAAIHLVSGGHTTATRQLSAHAPEISKLTVTPGTDGTRITWNVGDPDGDPVRSTVTWSADGKHWLPVALDTAATSILIGPGVAMPGGSSVRVKILANDGARQTELVSDPFSLAARAPMVSIAGLEAGTVIPQYFLGDLTALGYDPEERTLPGSALAWKSSVDGDLGKGPAISLRRLTPGEHTVTVTATDSTGATGVGTLKLTVVRTAAPALRMQGAEPDAERRLLAGSAVPSRLIWVLIPAGLITAAAIGGVVWFLVRRRRALSPA